MKGRIGGTADRLAEFMWKMWSIPSPSLGYKMLSGVMGDAKSMYRSKLSLLSSGCMEYIYLLESQYMKEKHWIYAILMAAAESLPLLYRKCTRDEVLKSILAKTSLGASSKLLDNLNDEIHTSEEALSSLENYLSALRSGEFEKKCNTPVERAESSACEMASWIYFSLNVDVPAFTLYIQDCTNLVTGQIRSLEHKKKGWPSLSEYIESIAEKSIGDVWIDIDLCSFDVLDDSLMKLKKANEYIFKSSLVYDDVQDIFEDIRTHSVNSAVILGIERTIISPDDLQEMQPFKIVSLLRESGILRETVYLADALFLKGVDILMQVKNSCIDMKGLLKSFKLVRLFNLRKLLMMNKDFWTLKQFLASFSDFEYLRDQVPIQFSLLTDGFMNG
ncbi:MAG: hypothetical protein HXS54_15000 [Theionarchaea archaeon]|nr:hypothetical protein [Theionarchaea archaeon]